ncbi:unnamed protein product [Boreogadus saida]
MATGEDRRELVEVRKKAELGLLDVAVTPTSKCGKGQRRKIPNSKNLEPSEDGNDEHVAERKTKSKRKQASTAQSASKSILQKYKNAQKRSFQKICKPEKRANKDGLATTGYCNWKRALDYFREHEKTALHKASMMAWIGYKATKVHGDVTEQILAASAAEITERRLYLHRVVSVMLFLAKQGIAFRGHCEEGFHRFLQGTSFDLARAVQFKSAIHDTLVSQRTEQVAEELYEVTKQLCSDHNLPEPSPAPRRKQRRMDDFVVEASTGSGSDLLNDSRVSEAGAFLPVH